MVGNWFCKEKRKITLEKVVQLCFAIATKGDEKWLQLAIKQPPFFALIVLVPVAFKKRNGQRDFHVSFISFTISTRRPCKWGHITIATGLQLPLFETFPVVVARFRRAFALQQRWRQVLVVFKLVRSWSISQFQRTKKKKDVGRARILRNERERVEKESAKKIVSFLVHFLPNFFKVVMKNGLNNYLRSLLERAQKAPAHFSVDVPFPHQRLNWPNNPRRRKERGEERGWCTSREFFYSPRIHVWRQFVEVNCRTLWYELHQEREFRPDPDVNCLP